MCVASVTMSSSAPWAMPSATMARQHAVQRSAAGSAQAGTSTHGDVVDRQERPLGRDDDAVDPEVVAAGATQPGDRPGVLDHDLVWREERDSQLRDTVDDALDAVAEQPVGVLAATDEGPPARDAISAIDGFDRAGGVDRSGDTTSGPVGEEARRTSVSGARRGRATLRHRSSRSRPPTRLPGRAPRRHASRLGRSAPMSAVAGGAGQPERAGPLELVE